MSAELGKCICEALSSVLTPCGYTSRERLFAHESADVVHLVQLQGSGTNTGLSSKYTVNLGIWVPALALGERPSVVTAHWRQRLGFLCPERKDMWWQTSPEHSAATVAKEVADRVQRYAIPVFASLANARALLAVWQSGTSPGLTKVQAGRFAQLLAAHTL